MSDLLHVSSSPHIRSKASTDTIMFLVLAALLPATCMGIYLFGIPALTLIIISVGVCVLTEYVYELLMHKPITIKDGSAMVTGLLLALNLPAGAPWWIPVIGGVWRCFCNFGGKTAFRGAWTEYYESGARRQMFSSDFFSGTND